MSIKAALIEADLTSDIERNDSTDTIELSMLTALICLGRFSEKGKALIDSADDELIMELFNTYSRVKLIG